MPSPGHQMALTENMRGGTRADNESAVRAYARNPSEFYSFRSLQSEPNHAGGIR
jgi:hypothetical protein